MCIGGAGVFKYANGNVYDGLWKDDKKNGRGEGAGCLNLKSGGAWRRIERRFGEVAGGTGVEMRDGARGGA